MTTVDTLTSHVEKKTFGGGLHTAAADVDRLFSRHFFLTSLTFCSPFSCVSEQRRHGYVTSWIGGEAVTLQIINQLLTNTSFLDFLCGARVAAASMPRPVTLDLSSSHGGKTNILIIV